MSFNEGAATWCRSSRDAEQTPEQNQIFRTVRGYPIAENRTATGSVLALGIG